VRTGLYCFFLVCRVGGEDDAVSKKTAHQLSHDRAELRYRSRLRAWKRPVDPASTEDQAVKSIIACIGLQVQRCRNLRLCTYHVIFVVA